MSLVEGGGDIKEGPVGEPAIYPHVPEEGHESLRYCSTRDTCAVSVCGLHTQLRAQNAEA